MQTQRFALKSFVLDICKVFEEKKKNKLNSLPSIIDFIQGSRIMPVNSAPIISFVDKYGENIKKKNCFAEPLKNILNNFNRQHKNAFKKYKAIRDSKFAHLEDIRMKNINILPSYDIMEKMLFFAVEFYDVIHQSYIGGYPVKHIKEKRTFVALCTVFKNMDYANIKTELEN